MHVTIASCAEHFVFTDYISLKRPFPLSTAIPASSARMIEVDHSLIRTRPTVSQCSSSQMIPEFTAGRGPIVYGSARLAPFSFGDKYSNILKDRLRCDSMRSV